VNALFSARDVLEPIRRMYTDPQVSSQGMIWLWTSAASIIAWADGGELL
jgi:hypothetical protein